MIKTAVTAFVVALALSGLSGCSTIAGPVLDRLGERMDGVVADYCDRDERARAALRDRVNEAVSPNAIIVECAADDN